MVGFVIAMQSEALPLLSMVKESKQYVLAGRDCYEGELSGEKIAVIVCGIGKVNAASATQALVLRYQPDIIINIGVAGAVNPDLKVCDVCAVSKAVQYDFDITAIDDVPVGYIQNIKQQYIYTDKKIFERLSEKYKAVTVASADRFSFKKSEAEFIKTLGGDLRDMELGAIAQVCFLNNVPYISLKTVSDTAGGSPAQEFIINLDKSTACVKEYIGGVMSVLKEFI